jgi:hypothetical protein
MCLPSTCKPNTTHTQKLTNNPNSLHSFHPPVAWFLGFPFPFDFASTQIGPANLQPISSLNLVRTSHSFPFIKHKIVKAKTKDSVVPSWKSCESLTGLVCRKMQGENSSSKQKVLILKRVIAYQWPLSCQKRTFGSLGLLGVPISHQGSRITIFSDPETSPSPKCAEEA